MLKKSQKKLNKRFQQKQCDVKKTRRTLRHHMSNRLLSPEMFTHHVLFSFYLFRGKKRIVIRLSTNILKQTARERSPGCWKRKQNKV